MKHLFSAAASAATVLALATPVTAQVKEQDNRAIENFNRLYELGSDVCVTDPCPVSKVKIVFLDQEFEALRIELPERTVCYVYIDGEHGVGRGGLYSCGPQNYVEVSPAISCTQLA